MLRDARDVLGLLDKHDALGIVDCGVDNRPRQEGKSQTLVADCVTVVLHNAFIMAFGQCARDANHNCFAPRPRGRDSPALHCRTARVTSER